MFSSPVEKKSFEEAEVAANDAFDCG